MPLNSIVAVVMRLFALSWLVQGITGTASVFASEALYPSSHMNYWNYAVSGWLLIIATAAWFLAQPVAWLVTPPSDANLDLGGLSRQDLYCFAFVFLGLYFVLSSLANTINWTHHYTAIAKVTSEADRQRQSSFYELTQPLITLIAGAVCLLFAPRIVQRLTRLQRTRLRE